MFAKHAGAQVFVVDVGVAADFDNPKVLNKKVMYGTKNIAKGPAMTRKQAQQAVDVGIEMAGQLAREGVQIIATGEMGVGNTTTSAAVAAAYFPNLLEQLVGRGAGVSEEGFLKKRQAVRKALLINQPDTADPLDVLSKVGGLDIAGICGLFLGGKKFGLPVVIDGFISAVGAFLAWKMDAGVRKYMIASHKSAEGGAGVLLNAMHQKAFLDLSMRLGEGTGRGTDACGFGFCFGGLL